MRLLEAAEPVAQVGLRLGVSGPELLLALLEAVDGRLALLGMAFCHGTVEDQPAHAALVRRCVRRLGRSRLPAQCAVERPHRGADPGIAEVDAGRVVPQVAAHPGRYRIEPGKCAERGPSLPRGR